MLSIQIEWSKEKFELNVVGHAGYMEHGKGYYVFAVSVIVIMSANEIENHEEMYPGQRWKSKWTCYDSHGVQK